MTDPGQRMVNPILCECGCGIEVTRRFVHGHNNRNRVSIHRRFFDKVLPVHSGCWLWIGGRDRHNYGKFWVDGRLEEAHRHAHGAIPEGLVIDHLCRHPWCVNPLHLEAVTQTENLRRGSPAGWQQFQSRKTHCPQGHPYDEQNTYFVPGEKIKRQCRTCKATRAKSRPDNAWS